MIRTGDAMGDLSPAIKYNLEDVQGTCMSLLDDTGDFVNREEYYPFGETSFGSYALKRYRFQGKEKDTESGLYYYGARYYCASSCRFISVDAVLQPEESSYVGLANNPVNKIDPDGNMAIDGDNTAQTLKGDRHTASGAGYRNKGYFSKNYNSIEFANNKSKIINFNNTNDSKNLTSPNSANPKEYSDNIQKLQNGVDYERSVPDQLQTKSNLISTVDLAYELMPVPNPTSIPNPQNLPSIKSLNDSPFMKDKESTFKDWVGLGLTAGENYNEIKGSDIGRYNNADKNTRQSGTKMKQYRKEIDINYKLAKEYFRLIGDFVDAYDLLNDYNEMQKHPEGSKEWYEAKGRMNWGEIKIVIGALSGSLGVALDIGNVVYLEHKEEIDSDLLKQKTDDYFDRGKGSLPDWSGPLGGRNATIGNKY